MTNQIDKAQVIPIDEGGRYVLIISSSNMDELQENLKYLRHELKKWWDDKDAKFFVLAKTADVDILMERMQK